MNIRYHPEASKFIEKLPAKHISKILEIVDLFEKYGFSLTSNYLKKVFKEVWELRAGRYRLLFGRVRDGDLAVVVFLKKTQKTPKELIDLAIRRLSEYGK